MPNTYGGNIIVDFAFALDFYLVLAVFQLCFGYKRKLLTFALA